VQTQGMLANHQHWQTAEDRAPCIQVEEDDATLSEELASRLALLRQGMRPGQSLGVTKRLWNVANKLSLAICGLIGARFVLNVASSSSQVTLGTLATATLSALLTAFGGGLQSKWLQHLASGGSSRLRSGGPKTACYITVLSGVVLAVILHSGGMSVAMEGRVLKWIASVNVGICAGLAVTDSGWTQVTRVAASQYSEASMQLGEAVRRTRAWATHMSQRKCSRTWTLLAAAPGTFMYMFGGGVWRDLLGRTMPGAFQVGSFVPAGLGVMLCALLYEYVDKRQGGTCVLIAGVPAACLLFATWPL